MTSSHTFRGSGARGQQKTHTWFSDPRSLPLVPRSLVRNHPQHFGEIAIAHQTALSEFPLGFRFLRRQDVAQLRVSALHLSCRRLLEALRSALVRFQLRHKNLSNQQLAMSQCPGLTKEL